jgi:hypothetical protein
MPVKEEEYRGLTIRAACFEVVGTQRFIASLLICGKEPSQAAIINLPVTHLDFGDEEQALEFALSHGRLLIDGWITEPTRY